MLIVVDTNVMWQAFRNPKGISGEIIRLILTGKLTIALSDPVFLEYEDVLQRPSSLQKFGATADEVDIFINYFVALGKWLPIWYRFRPNLKDEADNMFVELAVTAGSSFLITNNIGDFTRKSDLKFDDLIIVTPRQFIEIWRRTYE